MHLGISNQELTKHLAEKYRQLPQEEKQKYAEEYRKEKQEFEEKLAQFKRNHPGLVQNSRKAGGSKRRQTKAPKKVQGNVERARSPRGTEAFGENVTLREEPKKPPMTGYHKFHEDWWSSEELKHLPPRERWVEMSRRWHLVPPVLKEHYSRQAEGLQKQYWVDLDLWLQSLSPQEYAAYRKRSYGKGKIVTTAGDPNPRFAKADRLPSPARRLPEAPRGGEGAQGWKDGSLGEGAQQPPSPAGLITAAKGIPEEEAGGSSWDSSSGDERDDGGSSSSGESSAMDVI
ncbi:PREDICTED: upstream-binding factor 1-like protein 1 [Chinchilla lanigera]|uniref:upstream-binding factor 1-like protein 1 n=1 Tax=Chinchilla lanigera TaxID=34839 RepID=UPI0006984265|nr:PREDICTED: upstream-binding factor 1-like protein 1 [Chinchilla lanigera]